MIYITIIITIKEDDNYDNFLTISLLITYIFAKHKSFVLLHKAGKAS